jgi:hypothetical protein
LVAKGRGRKGHRDWSIGGVRGLYTLCINIVNIVNIGRWREFRRWSYPFSSQLLTVYRQRNQAQVGTNGLSVYFRIFNLAMRYLAITPRPPPSSSPSVLMERFQLTTTWFRTVPTTRGSCSVPWFQRNGSNRCAVSEH